ncbi:actin cytoskeleton-regulatory complex protein SLA1-like [Pyrus ussuriensis x Pyrus communis]|uniref:Actin cytoskeleton-regulatory complex protein SLA1-like n=1 Tax=Pyrus ussuriensis x Pyrus communis TaxID=2448454 RepID=A0A5N5F2H3_9ROSA|nr:actin cytoskeleton-regulatory complex protein SLA1-like [Pyrus ussuriensis x Pyrus communis]
MGGCATKPKVSKGEAASEVPVLAPEPTAKEDQPAVVDDKAKEKEAVLVADGDEAEKKIEIAPEPESEPEEAQSGGNDIKTLC